MKERKCDEYEGVKMMKLQLRDNLLSTDAQMLQVKIKQNNYFLFNNASSHPKCQPGLSLLSYTKNSNAN